MRLCDQGRFNQYTYVRDVPALTGMAAAYLANRFPEASGNTGQLKGNGAGETAYHCRVTGFSGEHYRHWATV